MSLRPAQFSLPGPIESGSGNLAALRVHQKVRRLEDHIETGCFFLAYRSFGCRHLELDYQHYEPVPCGTPLKRSALRGKFDGLRLPNPDPAHRRHIDAFACDADTLWDTKRRPGALLGLEPGELGPALEEN